MDLRESIKRNSQQLKLFIYALTVLLILIKGPLYSPDSYAHINMYINRSVLYSIFVNIPIWIMGSHNGYLMIILHIVFYLFCLEYFFKKSRSYLNFSNFSEVLLVFVFCFFVLFIYPFANFILSEAISAPLLLLCLAKLIEIYRFGSAKQMVYFAIIFFLLMITRSQFIIFLPFFIVLFFIKFKRYKKSKYAIVTFLVITTIPILSKLTEQFYYKMVLKEDIGYTMTYVHLISSPFYVSSIEDKSLFTEEEEQSFFARTKDLLDSQSLNYDFAKINNLDEFDYFQDNFTRICNAAIHESNLYYYQNEGFSLYDRHRKVDELTSKLFFPLLKKNFKKWLVLTYKGFKKGLRRSYGMLIIALLFIFALFFLENDLKHLAVFFVSILILKLGLHIIIAMAVHSIHRYVFYFDWLEPMIIVLMGDKIINYKEMS